MRKGVRVSIFLNPGQKVMLKLKLVKIKASLAWQELRHLAVLRYSRFL